MFSPKILHDAAILWYKEQQPFVFFDIVHAPRFT